MLALLLPLSTAAAMTVGVQVNPLTGIAIDGYDPVSYFTEPEPLHGVSDHELVVEGVPWHFANRANLEVFRRAPHIYMPQYGGHGAMSMARGYLSEGNPRIYVLFKQRLYFFYSVANREAFLLAPDKAARDGTENWRRLLAR